MANIRQSIVSALATRFATITTGNGYSATVNVHEWLVTPLEESDLPALIFRDTEDSIDRDEIGTRIDHTLTVEIDVAASSSTSASVVRGICKDVMVALGTDKTLGGLAYDIQPITVSIDVNEADQRVSGGQVVIEVKYKSNIWAI